MNNVNSQSYIQGFNSFNGLIHDGDWVVQNKSTPKGTVDWMQGNPIVFDSYNGEKRSFAAVNYNSTSTFGENNTINNWLLTPTRVFRNGDVFIFYTRKQTTNNTPDRLEIRFSKNGASVNVGTSSTDVGDFTKVLKVINPELKKTDYPIIWTKYEIKISGLTQPTSGRIAFRYFIPNAGIEGVNGDYIGIDQVEYISSYCENLASPTGLSPQSYTSGATVNSLNVVGSNIKWYYTESDAKNRINVIPSNTLIENNTTYYATQTVGSCESESSVAIKAINQSLAIDELNGGHKIKLYPNPTKDKIYFTNSEKIKRLVIFSIEGKLVLEKDWNNSTELNISYLANGIYLMNIYSNDGQEVVRFIKN